MILFKLSYKIISICLLLLCTIPAVANDDFIILLDQSASMREKQPGNSKAGYEKPEEALKAIKSSGAIRAINDVVDLLREGDYFSLITFGKEATLFLSQEIRYKHEREVIKSQIGKLRFEDQYTDIPAALKKASILLDSLNTPQRRKILVMITDGKNEPPKGSPFEKEEAQLQLYQQLKDSIRFYKWNMVLLGLGVHTDVSYMAQQLGLPLSSTLVVDDYQSSGTIKDEIAGKVKKQQDSRVEPVSKDIIDKGIQLQLKPKLFGGYNEDQVALTLKSTFEEEVKIVLQTNQPLKVDSDTGLTAKPTLLELILKPNQSASLNLIVSFHGKRPEQGYADGKFSFQFAEGTTPFYPSEVNIKVILPSWWDVYGLWAIIASVGLLILLMLVAWFIYRAQVPEVRIAVVAGNRNLGEPMTLRLNESFSIANGEFAKKSIPATGLSCKTAANVKYLGRYKFEIVSEEAKIIYDGKEQDRIIINMDNFFDLKDKTGKTLSSVMISKPGRAGEFAGARSYDLSPF